MMMNEDWYTDYKDYMAYLEDGNIEPTQDNPSDDWEQCMQMEALTDQEMNLENDYWFEYANGERANG